LIRPVVGVFRVITALPTIDAQLATSSRTEPGDDDREIAF
jgi:hypothetical protein